MTRLAASLVTVLTMAACGSDDNAADASSDFSVTRDLAAAGHCLASTPPTILNEGDCALEPRNGYCFIDFLQPTF
jgi:hypothetical protein